MTAPIPAQVTDFLASKRIAVAGVSHQSMQPANSIFQKLKKHGYEVFAVNPKGGEVEGVTAYPDLHSITPPVDAVMVVTHPSAAPDVVREAAALGIGKLWFHRSVDHGSVSQAALEVCERSGIKPIVGGCPMMYIEPDVVHKCMRWVLKWSGQVPG